MILVHKGDRVTVESGIMHKTKGEYIICPRSLLLLPEGISLTMHKNWHRAMCVFHYI